MKPENILIEHPTLQIVEIMKKFRKIPKEGSLPLTEIPYEELSSKQKTKLKKNLEKKGITLEQHLEKQKQDMEEQEKAKKEQEEKENTENVKKYDCFDLETMKVRVADFGNACWTTKHFTVSQISRFFFEFFSNFLKKFSQFFCIFFEFFPIFFKFFRIFLG